MIYVDIKEEKLQLEALIEKLKNPESGAISVFSGITRNNFNGKEVVKLEYTCYKDMALKEMKKICEYCIDKFGLTAIGIEHRLGEVPVSDASVNIVSLSSHRKSAIEATAYCIDELKRTVPIWKKEHYVDGSVWKENAEFKDFVSHNK